MKKHSFFFLGWCTLFALILVSGCKKTSDLNFNEHSVYNINNVFDDAGITDNAIKGVMKDMQKQNDKYSFMNGFIARNGFPRWSKTIYQTIRSESQDGPNRISTDQNGQSQEAESSTDRGLFFIPMQNTSTNEVSAYVAAYKHDDSTYTYRVYNKDSLSRLTPVSQESKINLMNTQAVFAYFEGSINGKNIIDIQAPVKGKIRNATLKFNPSTGNSNVQTTQQGCTVTVNVTITYESYSGVGICVAGIPGAPSVNMTIDIDCSGTGGGSGWWNTGTGLPWNNNPDPNWQWWWTGGGGGGGNSSLTDSHGFLYSRINELNIQMALNQYSLTPCDSLNIMPLDPDNAFGKMYQRVAQYKLPQYVKDRIDSIRNVAPNWFVDDFNLQSIDDAFGTVVNCDYFPVRIKKLPLGMNAKDLTEYFRKNINQFIDPSVDVSFSPYHDGNFYDTAKFNSAFENSLGALLQIQMVNDGSVILSEYYNNDTPGAEKHRFKFSTIETPADYEHPVAGNREFGVYEDPTRPGEFTFYTMGVDRTWDLIYAIGNFRNRGFESADKVWSSMQKKMIDYITANGGQAEYYSQKRIIARPDWDDVKDYLEGLIDFTELKQRLGC